MHKVWREECKYVYLFICKCWFLPPPGWSTGLLALWEQSPPQSQEGGAGDQGANLQRQGKPPKPPWNDQRQWQWPFQKLHFETLISTIKKICLWPKPLAGALLYPRVTHHPRRPYPWGLSVGKRKDQHDNISHRLWSANLFVSVALNNPERQIVFVPLSSEEVGAQRS